MSFGRSADLRRQLEETLAPYPEARSKLLPALRLAQERHGWLSPDALREVAEALDLTPAVCMSVASFYDMFHLEPVGRHLVEVCTNICCGLVGAQAVLDAFSEQLAIAPGTTTPDGEITLRAVECLGACDKPATVSIDGRYHEQVTTEQVAGLIQGVRGG